jgi:outer membrane PBP1 activator LpoA protein
MGSKTVRAINARNKFILCVIMAAFLLSACGTLAPHDPAAPASHHAQRKYDEAVRKGAIVPMEKGKEDRK